VNFEQVGRDHLRLGADLPPGHRRRGTGYRCRARTIGPQPIGRGVGVALLDGDIFSGNAKLARQDLGERRRVSLALADRAEPCDHAARRVHPNFTGIEHAEPENVAILDRSGADDLGKEADPDAHQLAGLATGEGFAVAALLVAQSRVADRVQRLVERGQVVTAVVFPAERRLIGELLFADQIAAAHFRWVHPELARQNIDHPLDEVRRLGHPERAAIRDTPRRLIGIDALDRHMGDRDVVGPGADAEKSGRIFGRVGAGVKRAVIGQYMAAQCGDAALLGGRDFAAHVVVAGESCRLQILHAVFDPLDRHAKHD
jgi:hypothetical protein